MAIAIILGALIGAAGFLPLIWGMNKARVATPTSNLGHAGSLLLGVCASLGIVLGAMILCILLVRDMALPFVLAEAAGLVVVAIVFGVKKQIK